MIQSAELKLFGLSAEQGRWVLICLGFVISICTGTLYSWSIFTKPLEEEFKIGSVESGLPYMLALAFFGFLMPIAGKFLDKHGPKIVTPIGGLVYGLGWILSGFAPNIAMITICLGIIGGCGVGISYGAPIAVATKWFPEKKGLVVGLTLIGVGIAPFITAPLSQWIIDKYGVLNSFIILGTSFLLLVVFIGSLLTFPPKNWLPRGYTPKSPTMLQKQFTTTQMLKTSSFWALWLCYVIGTTSGLMAIRISKPVGVDIIKLDCITATLAVSIFALFNGFGRPIFGWLTDFSPKYSAIISFIIIFFASLSMLNVSEGSTGLWLICFSALWLTFGGWLTITPTATATFFGTQHYSKNYGVVFIAYSIGAIIGTLVSGIFKDLYGSYLLAFYPMTILAVLGILISIIFLNPPNTSTQ